jgi:hypothetical protein
MTDFIRDLENELRAAERRKLRLAAARLPRPPATAVVSMLSAAVCVLVVLGVLQTRGTTRDRSTSASSVSVQLASNFAVFRRARTPADGVPGGLRFQCDGPDNVKQYVCFIDQKGASAPRARQVPSQLQLDQSRRLTLIDGLGTAWLIPARSMLCVLIRFPSQLFFRPFPGTMTCESVQRVLARPPMQIDSFLFDRNRGGYELAVEPDRITSATITYPGGWLPAHLNQGFLIGCAGQGDYRLLQTTSAGTTLPAIAVGGYGPTRSASCPRLHQTATVTATPDHPKPHGSRSATTPRAHPSRVENAVLKDCVAHGSLTHDYTKDQLRRALAEMPAAVRKYTNCPNVIKRAQRPSNQRPAGAP